MITEKNTTKTVKKGTILVAEDSEMSYVLLERILKKMNFDVLRAKNGKEAIEIQNSFPAIDLIFMDMQMPEIDGFEATRHIKTEADVPIIAITAHDEIEYLDMIKKSGCDAYIRKPFSLADIESKIKKFIDKCKRMI